MFLAIFCAVLAIFLVHGLIAMLSSWREQSTRARDWNRLTRITSVSGNDPVIEGAEADWYFSKHPHPPSFL